MSPGREGSIPIEGIGWEGNSDRASERTSEGARDREREKETDRQTEK